MGAQVNSLFHRILRRGAEVTLPAVGLIFLFCTAGYAAAGKIDQVSSISAQSEDTLVVLTADSVSAADPRLTVWLDTAAEEGLHAVAIRDPDLQAGERHYVGVVVPDGLHLVASDELLATLHAYVQSGGNLMLVYDSGTLTPGGKPQPR